MRIRPGVVLVALASPFLIRKAVAIIYPKVFPERMEAARRAQAVTVPPLSAYADPVEAEMHGVKYQAPNIR